MQRRESVYRASPALLLACLVLLCSRVVGHMARGEPTQSSNQMNAPILTPQASTFEGKLVTPSGATAPTSGDDMIDLAIELHRSLRFEPPHVEFGAWSVGTAHSQLVTLVNQNANRSVYLSSVSGRMPAFYSSFFEAKVVPPQGNTTFSVVFLPRENGVVATDLLIHTSFGQARLLVRGEGRECPYRLKPIVGIKAPLNATLTPEIHMYNPHGRPLQILEVYSSGGQFQLELPSGAQEGPQTMWEIPAHTTKPVIRLRFHGSTAGNYTAYIRIKISERPVEAQLASEHVLVVPVEFEILPQHGLYAENPLLDFGRLTTHNKTLLHLKLKLRNSHERRAYELSGQVLRVVPGLSFNPSDGSFTLEPHLFRATTRLNELLLLGVVGKRNTSSPQQTEDFSVLVRAEVFKGTLAYDRNITTFVTQAENYKQGEIRRLMVRNDFELPLAMLNVSVQQNESSVLLMQFSDSYTGPGMLLAPGESMELLHLSVTNDSVSFKTLLRIYTNVTLFELPVVLCSGRLHVSTQDSSQQLLLDTAYNVELNLGAIPLAEMSHNGYIVLQNRNTLAIKLSTWDFQSAQDVYFHTTFLGCLRAALLHNNSAPVKIDNAKFTFCSHLNEGDVAVFQVAIQSYITEPHAGTLKIWTAYELITTTVKFRTWVGKLEVDQEKLYFKNCFPGQLCTSDLSIRSSFKYAIHLTSISFPDPGLRFKDFNANGSTIAPEAVTKVGRIYFEPSALCQNRCYIPLDGKNSAIAFPMPYETKGGPNNNLNFDEAELRRRTELYRHMKYFQSTSFTLNSREVRQFQLQLIIDLEWPKLVAGGKQALPTVEVGKSQQMSVLLTNPADSPILVDYFLANPRYAEETKLSLPHEVVDMQRSCYLTNKAVFSLPDGAPRQPVLVPARSTLPLLVQFEALEPDTYCTLLHVRNNLTLYEAVWLSAKTVQSQFRFGNRKPGAVTPLLFEIAEKHLAVCAEKSRTAIGHNPLVITKRAFTARNKGEIPIRIDGFFIGDLPCEGYGFKVIDCASFELGANESRKVEIAFSPDFTSFVISRALTLRTNLSYPVSYKLLAMLPPSSIATCAAILPRPPWEPRIRSAAIVLLATTFVLVLIAAHEDYGNILVSQSLLYTSRDKAAVHPFNLRNIASKTRTNSSTEATEESGAAGTTTTTVTLPPNSKSTTPPAASQHCRTGCQQKANCNSVGNNINNCKKRAVRKISNWSGRELPSSDVPSSPWTLDLSVVPAKHVPTFSERNFKLRLEAAAVAAEKEAKQCSNSSSSVSSQESGAKSPAGHAKDAVGGGGGSSRKQQQRTLKKAKTFSPQKAVGNDEVEREESIQRKKEQSAKSADKRNIGTSTSTSTVAAATAATAIVKSAVDAWKKVVETTVPLEIKPQPHIVTPLSVTGSKEQNIARKYGKTPGRERKRDVHHSGGGDASNSTTSSTSSSSSSSMSKRSERNKQKNKAINALNFNAAAAASTLLGAGVNCISSPWQTNSQVSFSDVLQEAQRKPTSSTSGNGELRQSQADTEHALLDNDLSRQQKQQALEMSTKPISPRDNGNSNGVCNSSSAELGPIGPRKSPSSTPVWGESVTVPISAANVQLPKPTISSNSSFFSNVPLPHAPYSSVTAGYNEPPQQQFMGVSTGLYELEYLLNLRQQQLQAQQQMQAQQQLIQSVGDVSNNWATALNTPNWFGGQATGGAANSWQAAAVGMVRPPPGLETSYQATGHTQQQQQQHAHHGRQQQMPIANNNNNNNSNGNHLDALPAPQATAADMQTFDPFSSLSSIWSENWNKHNNQRNNMN